MDRPIDPEGELEPSLASMSDSDVIRSFRDALIAVYPTLQRICCLEDDTQPYDDFDSVADVLWEVVVLNTLKWRDGLRDLPELPPYGYSQVPIGSDGFIEVNAPGSQPFRFIQFIGDRSFGAELFNAIDGVGSEGTAVRYPITEDISFKWVR